MTTRGYLLAAFKTYDAVVVLLALAAALTFASGRTVAEAAALLSVRLELYKFLALLGIAWASHGVFSTLGLYGSKRLEGWRREALDLLLAMAAVTAIAMALAWAAGFELPAPAAAAALMLALGYATALASRAAMRWLLRRVRLAGRNLNHVLVVGTNRRACRTAAEIGARPELGCRLVGFVDERWHDEAAAASGRPLVARVDTLRDYLRDNVVDEVIICIPLKSRYDDAARVVDVCREQGVSVRYMPAVFADDAGRFEDYNLVCSVLSKRNGPATLVKRTTDVLLSAALLVALAPLLACVALLIKLTSDGPVLFRQERVGLNKRRFRLYKFRTMTVDAESRRAELAALNESAGPTFKMRNDPRVTPLGRILRRTSVDELPQLVNVLLGDMSLVGPRPLPVVDYAGFSSDRHRKRLSVRPGITCLWQVQGRSGIPFDRWMELDLKYVDQWSLWLDFKILLQTIPAVIRAAGAS